MKNVKATMARKSRANNEKAETSSDNVFADLGFRDAEERLLKAKLATKVAQVVEKKGWTQAQTAERTARSGDRLLSPAWTALRLLNKSFVLHLKQFGNADALIFSRSLIFLCGTERKEVFTFVQ